MKPNYWQKMFGAKRRASDKKLLASLERDIANGEKLAAINTEKLAAAAANGERLAAANARKATAYQADDMPVHQISEEQRKRIAAAFGRPG